MNDQLILMINVIFVLITINISDLQHSISTFNLEYLYADPGKTSLFLVKDKNEVLGLRLSHSVSATVSNGE